MPKVLAENLSAGMIVEQDVKDRSGRLLLRSGCVLTDRTLKVLRTWGIAEVHVEQTDETARLAAEDKPHPLAEVDPALVSRAMERTEQLFRHVDMSLPAAATLASLVVEHLVQNPGCMTSPHAD